MAIGDINKVSIITTIVDDSTVEKVSKIIEELVFSGEEGDGIIAISNIESVLNIEKGFNPSDIVKLEIKYLSGDIKTIDTLCRIDTKNELEYYKNGGILQYVLRNMI